MIQNVLKAILSNELSKTILHQSYCSALFQACPIDALRLSSITILIIYVCMYVCKYLLVVCVRGHCYNNIIYMYVCKYLLVVCVRGHCCNNIIYMYVCKYLLVVCVRGHCCNNYGMHSVLCPQHNILFTMYNMYIIMIYNIICEGLE